MTQSSDHSRAAALHLLAGLTIDEKIALPTLGRTVSFVGSARSGSQQATRSPTASNSADVTSRSGTSTGTAGPSSAAPTIEIGHSLRNVRVRVDVGSTGEVCTVEIIDRVIARLSC